METAAAMGARPALSNDEDIIEDIDGHMHGPMSGFLEKFFCNFRHTYAHGVLDTYLVENQVGRVPVPSAVPSPADFVGWFSAFMGKQADGARGAWHCSNSSRSPEANIDGNFARLLLTMSGSLTAFRRNQVQVVGQFCQSACADYRDGLLRLCDSARQTFTNQPTRLFLHGFYMRGSLVEFWVFDRSGLYSSHVLDIGTSFVRFLSIILSYQRMTDYDLGNSNITKLDDGGSYIAIDDEKTQSSIKLYLESQPIASRDALVGTGTTCYRAKTLDSNRWSHVFKLKWRWARDRPEDEHLNLASKKQAWGAVSLEYFKEFEIHSCEDQRSSTEKLDESTSEPDGLAGHTEETDNFFQNRILSCSLTSPVGRSLQTFLSCKELLEVLRDAVKCHRSLYYDAGILHQDVSPGNVIIHDPGVGGTQKGALIDLDSGIEFDQEFDREFGITGTRPFMGIGLLRGEPHTYRHDLESFLYVFLWVVLCNHQENPPESSKLRQWSRGDWGELAACKARDMSKQGFSRILDEFHGEFHSLAPLAERLREIIIPLRNGALWTGTDESQGAVKSAYDEIIRAFEDAIGTGDFES